MNAKQKNSTLTLAGIALAVSYWTGRPSVNRRLRADRRPGKRYHCGPKREHLFEGPGGHTRGSRRTHLLRPTCPWCQRHLRSIANQIAIARRGRPRPRIQSLSIFNPCSFGSVDRRAFLRLHFVAPLQLALDRVRGIPSKVSSKNLLHPLFPLLYSSLRLTRSGHGQHNLRNR